MGHVSNQLVAIMGQMPMSETFDDFALSLSLRHTILYLSHYPFLIFPRLYGMSPTKSHTTNTFHHMIGV